MMAQFGSIFAQLGGIVGNGVINRVSLAAIRVRKESRLASRRIYHGLAVMLGKWAAFRLLIWRALRFLIAAIGASIFNAFWPL